LLIVTNFGLFACTEPGTPGNTKQLPNTPEEVVRQWQLHVDKNEFEAASKLSTSSAIEWLDMISTIISEENEEDIILTEFQQMKCTEKGDTARCYFNTIEEGLVIPDSMRVVKVGPQWKIDFWEEEDSLLDDEATQEIIEELDRIINETEEK